MGVADVPLVACLSDLPGTRLAAAAAIQHGTHPRGAVGSHPTLAGPLAELTPLSCSPAVSRGQLRIVLGLAKALGKGQEDAFVFCFFIPHGP